MAFPYELAKRLGIEPGEEVEFVDHNGNIIVKRVECE
jgi:bifunctional DNA-binding transcriptional regulator/antitoxin component of YhaV-PrlF toxin-antitoxin module